MTQFAPLHALDWTVFDWCLANCQPRMALDIGANAGGYTAKLAKAGFHVIAFEPVPSEFDTLTARFGDNSSVKLRNMALSDQPGIMESVTVTNAWTLGTPETTGFSVTAEFVDKPRFDVSVSTVDAQCVGLRIGFIKLDVDGYEPKVWRGAQQIITRDQPPFLCELSGYYSHVGEDPQDFIENVIANGYWIVSMDGKTRFRTWNQVKPCFPFHSSYDVMLIPERLIGQIPTKAPRPD